MLVFWDHGANIEGFGNDENFDGDPLQLWEIQDALSKSQENYHVIGFDSCLMATLEVAKVVNGKADFLLASEELEPGHGWNWKHVLEAYANAADAKNGAISIIDNFVAKGSHPIEQGGKTLSGRSFKISSTSRKIRFHDFNFGHQYGTAGGHQRLE